MSEFLNGQQRTHMCGRLTKTEVGNIVTIMGWVNRKRNLGSLEFVQLRDTTGICQVVFDTKVCDAATLEKAAELKLEYVVSVTGVVRLRGENVNTAMETGEIEVAAKSFKILSEAEVTPFSVGDAAANELLRLKYRYLDLRRPELQRNLKVRSEICRVVRTFLYDNNFCEIETPALGRSTPEGARDYLVPSRVQPGKYYALPQSPQLYKQLLMIGGMDRYFQIARCFRDEDLRANRQPEFTQVDIEISFIDKEEQIMSLMEGLVGRLFSQILGKTIQFPLLRLSYAEAMARFGSDKPDMRYKLEICDVSGEAAGSSFNVFEEALSGGGSVCAIVLTGGEASLSRKDLDRLTEYVKGYKAKGLMWYATAANGTIRSSIAKTVSPEIFEKIAKKTDAQKGDMIFLVADKNTEVAQAALGALRCNLAEKFNLIDKTKHSCLWVVDFPLFEYSDEDQRLVARHHPFTSPKDEDVGLFETAPKKMRAKAYDLVINGDEMGGGSLRIYNAEVQSRMFKALGFTTEQIKERFGFFADAFRYGTPPHGGIAFGLDRLTMTLTGTENIREVIAFPKLQNASDNMTQAPCEVEPKQLKELCIVNSVPEAK